MSRYVSLVLPRVRFGWRQASQRHFQMGADLYYAGTTALAAICDTLFIRCKPLFLFNFWVICYAVCGELAKICRLMCRTSGEWFNGRLMSMTSGA
jgi:hypothetical protein